MGFCSFCNHEGHNKRTCSAAKLAFCLMPEAPTPPTPPKRGYHCRTCGEGGHNSRNCPQGSSLLGTTPPTTGRHCRGCGEAGHNIRTCHVVKALLDMNQSCVPCSTITTKHRTPLVTNTIRDLYIPVEDHAGFLANL
jgi:hypothetical protein